MVGFILETENKIGKLIRKGEALSSNINANNLIKPGQLMKCFQIKSIGQVKLSGEVMSSPIILKAKNITGKNGESLNDIITYLKKINPNVVPHLLSIKPSTMSNVTVPERLGKIFEINALMSKDKVKLKDIKATSLNDYISIHQTKSYKKGTQYETSFGVENAETFMNLKPNLTFKTVSATVRFVDLKPTNMLVVIGERVYDYKVSCCKLHIKKTKKVKNNSLIVNYSISKKLTLCDKITIKRSVSVKVINKAPKRRRVL